MLLELNYAKTISNDASNKLYFADLIVDEQCGIVLQELHRLSEAHTVETVVNRMTKLSLQFSLCWLILYTDRSKHAGYPLGGQTVNNLSRLQAALTQFSTKNDGYEVKVLFADSSPEVAKLIHQIVDIAAKTTRNWSPTDWHARTWLTNTVSKHEKVLLQFPCLNAYSAQIMLTAAPLQKLLTMPLPHLVATCPWIQPKTLEMFHSVANGMQHHLPQPSSAFNSSSHSPCRAGQPAYRMQLSEIKTTTSVASQETLRSDTAGDVKNQHQKETTTRRCPLKQEKSDGYDWNKSNSEQGCIGQQASSREMKQEDNYGKYEPCPFDDGADLKDTKDSQDMTAIEYIATHIKQEPGVEYQPSVRKVPQTTELYHAQQLGKQNHRESGHQVDFVPNLGTGVSSVNEQKHYQGVRNTDTLRASALEHSQNDGAPRTHDHEHHQMMRRSTDARAYDQDNYQRLESTVAPKVNAQRHNQYARSIDDPRTNAQQYYNSVMHTGAQRGDGHREYYQSGAFDAKNHRPTAGSVHSQDHLQTPLYPSRMVPSSASSSYPEQPDYFFLQHQIMYNLQHQSEGSSWVESAQHSAYHREGQRDVQRQMVMMQGHPEGSAPEVPSLPNHPSLPLERNLAGYTSQAVLQRYHPNEWNTPIPAGRGNLCHHHQSFDDQSVPSSAEVDIDDYEESDDLGFEAEPGSDSQQVPLTPSKKRRLTYESTWCKGWTNQTNFLLS